ncbi:MAG TPA: hypothetical protein PK218_08550 [Flavobacterium sp.]|jgi:hypothetical protein|uniref:hypothetical protein n=1 Tax=Flavobacterium sp. TaxID=239 RepID=UPI002CF8C207|nr:hypothetical protein [Flavobacterium sp.]MCA0347731.1 hypothetical protein [Bacteroidota bacterium]HPW98596.1 hypothetical protein [Flavobacterium sp.]HQA74791.1 hypothetical protein [Flavobacterium sp.]
MKSTNFRYNINYKASDDDTKIIVLSQLPFFKGSETEIEIPLNDIDNVIESLKFAKDEIKNIDLDEIREVSKVILDASIVNTLVSLFLSGIPTSVLAKQYDLDENVVKENLEEKGIILFEEI